MSQRIVIRSLAELSRLLSAGEPVPGSPQPEQPAAAKALLQAAASENPGSPEINSLQDTIRRRQLAGKVAVAKEALWAARRRYRHEPAAAVARLEVLDVEGLPSPLAGQVFGEWARACARLCRQRGIEGPLRYAPHPGRGAVLARGHAGGSYLVVSALGLGPAWRPGSPVGGREVRLARPLR